MLPVVAIVGRPNVGKSSLFNQLTQTNDALVADFHGLTRDRIYDHLHTDKSDIILIDTGGLDHDHGDLSQVIKEQTDLAIEESDLIVINHHLLLADLTMKEEGFAEFLPDTKVMILDEAHQIPDLAAQFFGVSIGNIELDRLCNELLVIVIPLNQPLVLRQIDALKKALRQLLLDAPKREGRYEFSQIQADINISIKHICETLKNLGQVLMPLADMTETIEKKYELTELYFNRMSSILDQDFGDGLRWVDIKSRSLRLNLTPLDVGKKLRELFLKSKKSWIFTSATIAIGEDFSHFKERIGLVGAKEASFPSPFSLENNALIYLPPGLPEPSHLKFTEKTTENQNRKNTFVYDFLSSMRQKINDPLGKRKRD
mgnify:CR=1 FL=1